MKQNDVLTTQENLHTVTRIMQGIYLLLGDKFSMDELYEYVKCWRQGRSLVIWPDPILTADCNGYCIALTDVDLIGVRPNMNSFLRLTTEAHEIGHILSGHLDKRPSPYSLAEFLGRLDRSQVFCRGFTEMYDPNEEDIANRVEELVLECVEHQLITPRAIHLRDYFGKRG
jgi:hypothetical protein